MLRGAPPGADRRGADAADPLLHPVDLDADLPEGGLPTVTERR